MLFQNNHFVSDLHIRHYWVNKAGEERGVILFERTQFKDIAAHDEYIHKRLIEWAKNHSDATLWILGDFGDITYLYWIDEMRAYGPTVNFVMGNHDKSSDLSEFKEHFDNVYEYPVYLSNRVVLSHEPIWPAPASVLNIHGHLHSAELDSDQHLCVSINDIGYQPLSEKAMNKRLGMIPKACYKFLQEPYRGEYVFLKDKPDVEYDKNGKIKLQESIKKFNKIHNKDIK